MQLTPHDVVNIKLNKGDSNSPSLGQGTVYRIKVCKIFPNFDRSYCFSFIYRRCFDIIIAILTWKECINACVLRFV